jgi:hypothetical protein
MIGKMAGSEKPEDIINRKRIADLLKEHPEGRTAKEISKSLSLSAIKVRTYITTLSYEIPIGEEGDSTGTNYFIFDWRTL